MKLSNFIKKYWVRIFIYPVIFVLLFLATCGVYNFLLVPVKGASTIETIMAEAATSENIDIMFIGTSRTFRAVDAGSLSNQLGKNVFNIAHENATYATEYYLLKELYKQHKPTSIYLEVSSANFVRDEEDDDIYAYQTLTGAEKQEYAQVVDLDYKNFKLLNFTNYLNNFSNGKFWQNITLKTFKDPRTALEEDGNTEYKGKGFLYSKRKKQGKYALSAEYTTLSKASKQSEEYFLKILDFCQTNGIQVTLFAPPCPYTVISEYFENFNEFDQYLTNLTKDYHIDYFDLSKLKQSVLRLDDQYFYNANHCNGEGANAILPILENLIKDVDAGTYNADNYFYPDFETMVADYVNN